MEVVGECDSATCNVARYSARQKIPPLPPSVCYVRIIELNIIKILNSITRPLEAPNCQILNLGNYKLNKPKFVFNLGSYLPSLLNKEAIPFAQENPL